MKSLNLLFLFYILCSSSLAFAKPKAYLEVDDKLFSNPRLVIDGQEINPGFFGFQNVPEAMGSDPLAQALAKDYVSYRNWSAGIFWVTLAAVLIYAGSTSSDDFDSGVYWTVFGTGLISSSILGARAQTKLVRAVNQYNGVYESKETSWQIGPATKGLGLALRF